MAKRYANIVEALSNEFSQDSKKLAKAVLILEELYNNAYEDDSYAGLTIALSLSLTALDMVDEWLADVKRNALAKEA